MNLTRTSNAFCEANYKKDRYFIGQCRTSSN